ncbi:MAG TPA: carboxypeptidase-like regulatory domain-containing protein [Candidatus Binatia bacterium]|nr:carboxypeptidase-like regulatory domain-containing protein [Candidatus Binatia bacterium]
MTRPTAAHRSALPADHFPALRAGGRVALLTVFLILFFLAAFAASAQSPALKTVHGAVLTKSEDPIAEAVVFLKNLQNGSVRSYISDDAGGYRFSGLDPNADYEIHAEFKGDSSAVRRLSNLDNRKDIYLNLIIAHKK